MGMTREQFKVLVKGMKDYWTSPAFIPDQDAFNLWYKLLCDLDYRATGMAITYLMQTSRYEPKVADIRDKVREITEGPDEEVLEEQTAWNLVWKCVTGLDWNHPQEKYDRLPELIRRCVDLPMIISWAQMDEGEVQSVARSHFRASYQAMARRAREGRKISPRLKQEILGIALNRQEALTDVQGGS